ncbi:MAG: hypothetical protein ALECFALPRED_000337 [Alectoria fallacina]|uniref:Uncharacterized protein n=1 Tax=Alectoria fallacina TaxID=1903189 RepID=A0A8H3J9X8_9LECA|nr:MAG: hypothetical protein ALECFALPRED_000337 [Alectoria fallacina]
MSDLSRPSSFACEARRLMWYGKTACEDPRLDRPSNRRNRSSLGPRDPRYGVKVLRETPESHILEPFDQSKGQVVALVSGQALNCGIGPIKWEQRITYLSAKDVLKWSKLAEWLDKFDQRNPRHEFKIYLKIDLSYYDSVYWKLKAEDMVPKNVLSVHVSDFPGGSSTALGSRIWVDTMHVGTTSTLHCANPYSD